MTTFFLHLSTPRTSVTYVGDRAAALSESDPARAAGRSGYRDVVSAYVGLTKPRVIELLLLTTVAAIARLFVLRARASVLVDMPWLSALAHAQRRMGFKHGTALLVSDDLVSPVSWGVMRPIILLDSRAVAATHEAEAITAGWWWNAHGDLAPERLVLLVQELQRCCAVAAGHHALR